MRTSAEHNTRRKPRFKSWREYAAERKAKRKRNAQSSRGLIKAMGLPFTEPGPLHLAIQAPTCTVDIWLTTGYWRVRHEGPEGRGVREMLAHLDKETQERAGMTLKQMMELRSLLSH